jgi:hypothetical protein
MRTEVEAGAAILDDLQRRLQNAERTIHHQRRQMRELIQGGGGAETIAEEYGEWTDGTDEIHVQATDEGMPQDVILTAEGGLAENGEVPDGDGDHGEAAEGEVAEAEVAEGEAAEGEAAEDEAVDGEAAEGEAAEGEAAEGEAVDGEAAEGEAAEGEAADGEAAEGEIREEIAEAAAEHEISEAAAEQEIAEAAAEQEIAEAAAEGEISAEESNEADFSEAPQAAGPFGALIQAAEAAADLSDHGQNGQGDEHAQAPESAIAAEGIPPEMSGGEPDDSQGPADLEATQVTFRLPDGMMTEESHPPEGPSDAGEVSAEGMAVSEAVVDAVFPSEPSAMPLSEVGAQDDSPEPDEAELARLAEEAVANAALGDSSQREMAQTEMVALPQEALTGDSVGAPVDAEMDAVAEEALAAAEMDAVLDAIGPDFGADDEGTDEGEAVQDEAHPPAFESPPLPAAPADVSMPDAQPLSSQPSGDAAQFQPQHDDESVGGAMEGALDALDALGGDDPSGLSENPGGFGEVTGDVPIPSHMNFVAPDQGPPPMITAVAAESADAHTLPPEGAEQSADSDSESAAAAPGPDDHRSGA